MIRTKDELLSQLNGIIGENSSDEAISLIEDVSDSFDDLTNRVNDSGDWENRYNELDRTWRDRYRERFFNGSSDIDNEFKDKPDEPEKEMLTFDDLFVTK